jgi:CubicO group peptidase (beta-lactamase class C family)
MLKTIALNFWIMKKSIILLFLIVAVNLKAQVITSAQIDSLTELTLRTFDVPGIAVEVVKDGKIIHAKGYGVRSLNTRKRVDENTLFGIASNTKAFTVAALGMLIDEGKLKWDDKVVDYIPEFRMYNPYVTEEFTIRDLLTHRSGLGLGAGDLMFWPDSNNFTKKDMIHNLRYLKPVSSFRSKYDYDNNLYMVAGEVVARASGMSWENFIQQKILDPLGMSQTAPTYSLLKDKTNVIDPHAPVDGVVIVIRRDVNETLNSAGGIYSNLTDMCKWINMQMNNGKYDGDKQLLQKETHEEMWTPQTIIPVRGETPYNTHFASYGLGWGLSDVHGYKQCTHTGGLAGIVTQVTLIPEIKLGIIVFTNQQSGEAFYAITNTIKDSYFGIKPRNWVKQMHDRVVANQGKEKDILDNLWAEIAAAEKSNERLDINVYTGTFTDPWFGDVEITAHNGKMWFRSKRSFILNGEMLPYKGNTFVVKWGDRSLDADAFVMFDLDKEGKASAMKMNAISPLTDFSFDFQDLDFKRIK